MRAKCLGAGARPTAESKTKKEVAHSAIPQISSKLRLSDNPVELKVINTQPSV
ncbi:hypothetical protein KTH71_04100 [Acinetobacter sp. WU_MDCI_Axc73]|nr:hypothetical protein [Acinetobacter sp. WU_MDCI_Axc73]